jgi:hypothetical protein
LLPLESAAFARHRQTFARLAFPQATAVMDVAFGGTVNDADTVAKYLSIFFGAT